MALPADTALTLTIEGQRFRTTLGLFLADNPGDDALDAPAVTAALARGEVYRGGGGAQPEWQVERAPESRS